MESELLRQLYQGPRSAKELGDILNISQASFSRLAEKVKQVKSVGKGRATRYIALRNIRGIGYRFPVFEVSQEGECTLAGELSAFQTQGFALEKINDGTPEIYRGLPFFLTEARPQGFLGRSFSHRNQDLNFPQRLQDWTEDDFIEAIVRRGEDAAGNLIVGEESFRRYQQLLARPMTPIKEKDTHAFYVRAADDALQGIVPGSSAAGEQPKFTAVIEEAGKPAHVLVKFSPSNQDPLATRWKDLLIAEHLALKTLADHGVSSSRSKIIEKNHRVFLEVLRFDRVGAHGRIGLISLGALDDQWFGSRDDWVLASRRLKEQKSLSSKDASLLRLLYSFAGLIANTDTHFGNISFFWELGARAVQLAPVYDMLPMLYAPVEDQFTEREFTPPPPHAYAMGERRQAIPMAIEFWKRVAADERISENFRTIAKSNQEKVHALLKQA